MIDKPPVNLLTLPTADATDQAREAGRRVLADPDALRVIWPELAAHFATKHAPWAPDGVSDDEFDTLSRNLLNEFRAGLQEAIRHVAEVVGGAL